MPTTDLAVVASDREPSSVDGKAVALDAIAASVELLRQVEEKVERYTKLRDQLQTTIKDKLGDAEIGTLAGRPVVTWKGSWRLAVSQSLLKERYPTIATDVCQTSWVRRFRLLDA